MRTAEYKPAYVTVRRYNLSSLKWGKLTNMRKNAIQVGVIDLGEFTHRVLFPVRAST
jgi:hypothetical protein